MFRELSDIKVLRKRLDITQSKLASLSGVSQSLIAKIEAGKIDPTYTNAKKIFETLEELSTGKKLKADDVMRSKIISAKPKEKISEVIIEMKKHGISQLPVTDTYNHLVGLITESIILSAMLEGKKKIVEEIMDERPPSVSKETTIDIVSGLLKFFPMVTVFDKQKMIGIITKADIIEKL